MSTRNPLGYRRDIQILRGLAVIAVVGYHLRIPGFNNGFLGVDLFFVMSGYLMAAIYPNGQIKSFYLHRARRLLPAFITTTLITISVSYFLVVPSDLIQVIQQARSSFTLVPNFYFWSQDSYFSRSSFNPLLHLWSLGVEFQFYLILPVLMWLLSTSKISKYLVFFLSIISCFTILSISPKTSFFLPFSRIWEFVAGIIAFGLLQKQGRLKSKFYRRIFGGFLCVFSFVFFFLFPIDGFSTSIFMGHPGIASLIITILGSAYLILAPNIRFGAWLEMLGKYSYSIYLVHFPLIVLLQYEAFSGTNLNSRPLRNLFIEIFLTGFLAFLLFSFVEEPMRKASVNVKFWVLLLLSFFVLISIIPIIKLQQLSQAERSIVDARFDRSQYRCGKIFRVINLGSKVCVVGDPSNRQKILLLGNSHADAIKQSFAAAANKNAKTVFFWVQNDPLMSDVNDASEIIKQIEVNNISEVFFHYSSNAVKHSVLVDFIEKIQSRGISVTVMGPVPTWGKSVPEEVWSYRNSSNKSSYLLQSIEDFQKRNFDTLSTLKSKFSTSVRFLDVGKIFCIPLCQYQDTRGILYYWDSGHLTLSGAKVLYPMFLNATRS